MFLSQPHRATIPHSQHECMCIYLHPRIGRNFHLQAISRATKQRNDLLQSFDTLTSHLNTTFTSLSTAFARCSSKRDTLKSNKNEPSGNGDRSRAYLAILVGPSTASARSGVLLLFGLELEVWGEREFPKTNVDEGK